MNQRPPSLAALAGPMILSRAGIAGMAIADALMVARFDTTSLARLGLGEAVIGRLLDVMVAFLLGGAALAAAALRGETPARAGAIWRRAMRLSLGLGCVGALVGLAGGPALRLAGEDPSLADAAGRVMAILGVSVPAALAAIASAVFLEAAGRPVVVALSVLGGNALNIALNWWLIGGGLGIPPLGSAGSAASTALVRVALMLILVGRVLTLPERRRIGIALPAPWREGRAERRLGLSAASTAALLNALGLLLTLYGGWLGALPLAALVALWTMLSLGALVALGIADATALMVAGSPGREAAIAQRNAMAAVALMALPVAVAAWAPEATASLFSGDARFQATLGGLIRPGCVIVLLDAVGFTLAGALRGLADAVWPAALQVAAALALAGSGFVLAFGAHEGAAGLVAAMLIASALRAGLLGARLGWRLRARAVLSAAR